MGLIPGSGEKTWRRKWQPIQVLLPGKSHGQRSLACYSQWGCKESDTTYGETVETVSYFIFEAPKSLQMVIAAVKLKDAYSWEGKL